ncbi:MAG: sigma 54-interacting transcriptional regulator [Calditrichota bacterium]
MNLSEEKIKSLLQFRALKRSMESEGNRELFLQKLLNATLTALDSSWGYVWNSSSNEAILAGTIPEYISKTDLQLESAAMLSRLVEFHGELLKSEKNHMAAAIWQNQQAVAVIHVFDKQTTDGNSRFTTEDHTLFAVLTVTGSMGLDKIALSEEKTRLFENEPEDPLKQLIRGHSSGIRQLRKEIQAVLNFKGPVSVLVQGESGTGKELVAEAVRRFGPYSSGTYKVVNCASFSKDLLKSELFGHKKGAFTGATSDQEGLLKVVDRGVLFLDEIGELPLDLQPMLLRVLENGSYRSVGGVKDLYSNFHLVCATNRDLKKAVAEGEFREDLYYRLDDLVINVPPLRERIEDIPVLLDYFLQKFNSEFETEYTGFTHRAIHQMEQYRWPGNVRELQKVVRKGMVFAAGKRQIDLVDLVLKEEQGSQDILTFHMPIPLKQAVASYVRYSYNKLDQHVTKTMDTLKIDYRQLMRHLGKRLDAHIHRQLKPGVELEIIKEVEEALQNVALTDVQLRGLKRAIVEAVVNAVEHSNSIEDRLKVDIEVTARLVKVRIRDFGVGFKPELLPQIDPEVKIFSRETRGWGVEMMKKSVDELRIDSGSEGTTVIMTINR